MDDSVSLFCASIVAATFNCGSSEMKGKHIKKINENELRVCSHYLARSVYLSVKFALRAVNLCWLFLANLLLPKAFCMHIIRSEYNRHPNRILAQIKNIFSFCMR